VGYNFNQRLFSLYYKQIGGDGLVGVCVTDTEQARTVFYFGIKLSEDVHLAIE